MKEDKINQVIEQAYTTLKNIAELNIHIMGGYLEVIIPKKEIETLSPYADEIINQLFWKFCKEISSKEEKEIPEQIIYHSFTFNTPSDSLLTDCNKIVREQITNKKSSSNTTLYSLLSPLSLKYTKEEVEKTLDTIFDVLLSYYISL